jgi:hypothetical protein
MKKQLMKYLQVIMVIAVFLAITINTSSVMAKNQSYGKSHKAFLTNAVTGEKVELPVTIQYNVDGKSIDYSIIVLSGSLIESHSRFDSSIGVKLTITQYFDEKNGTYHYVSLDRSTAKWEKIDSSITISNAKVGSKVYAYTAPAGGTLYNRNENRSIGTPTNNTWYTHNPSWRGVYLVVDDLRYQATQASSTLKRGGSTWTLGFCVAQGGAAVVNCE